MIDLGSQHRVLETGGPGEHHQCQGPVQATQLPHAADGQIIAWLGVLQRQYVSTREPKQPPRAASCESARLIFAVTLVACHAKDRVSLHAAKLLQLPVELQTCPCQCLLQGVVLQSAQCACWSWHVQCLSATLWARLPARQVLLQSPHNGQADRSSGLKSFKIEARLPRWHGAGPCSP